MKMQLFTLGAFLLACLLTFCGPARSEDFWSTWGDGRAELDGYALVQPRYGQLRKGRAAMIFVTEDHSVKEMVKIEGDPTRVPTRERFPVFKLNFIKHFQTGIYDYNVMTSVFARLDRGLQPSKVSLTLHEWCGQVYHQLVLKGDQIEETLHSYFGGEADQSRRVSLRQKAIFEDDIPILIREPQGAWLQPGQTLTAPAAPSLMDLRLRHKSFVWGTIKITKGTRPESTASVLGDVPVYRWTVAGPAGRMDYWVEAAWPHRIVKWHSDQGEEGVLTGTTRLPYWKLNYEGDEKYLKKLGF